MAKTMLLGSLFVWIRDKITQVGGMSMHKILVVEDDAVIRNAVGDALTQWGYQVVLVTDFDQVLDIFVAEQPQLVLLDITLPFFNGYFWCQELRKVSQVPVLFLSSRQEALDVVTAINMGGDDYVTKPFDMGVLVAKVQSLLRRSYEFVTNQKWLDYEGAVLDIKALTLIYTGQSVALTKNEFQILRVLFEQHGQMVSRDRLMRELWNSDVFIDDNTLTVNVARLRKKLEPLGMGDWIVTRKGVGYGLVKSNEQN